MASNSTSKKVRVGVMLEAVQLSDVIGMDILGTLSRWYMDQVKEAEFSKWEALKDHAMDIEFLYIATTLEPTFITPGLHFVPTVTYDSCPRDLDILLIGGPLPSHRPPQADKFLKEAWAKTRVVLTTCTGGIWLASAGVLDGKKCTTNRGFLDMAKQLYPKTEWLDQRWVVEEKPFDGEGKGELWTSGGAGAGVHMIANYCLEHFDQGFVNAMALSPLDFQLDGNTSQFYLS